MHDLSPSTLLRLRPEVRMRVVAGEAVILVQDRAVIVGLDPVGTRVFELMSGQSSPLELAASLRGQFEAGTADVEGDVLRFLTELVSLGVAEHADAPRSEATG